MRKVRFPVLSIVLYVLAGLLALYTIWAAINSFKYISEMVAMHQLIVRGNEFDIVNFHMTNFAQYALYTVILFALGRIVQINLSDVNDKEDKASLFQEIADEDVDKADLEDLEQSDEE